MLHSTSVTEAEHASEFKLTKDTPYPTLIGELWGVYCNDFEENWPHHHIIVEELCKKEVLWDMIIKLSVETELPIKHVTLVAIARTILLVPWL